MYASDEFTHAASISQDAACHALSTSLPFAWSVVSLRWCHGAMNDGIILEDLIGRSVMHQTCGFVFVNIVYLVVNIRIVCHDSKFL